MTSRIQCTRRCQSILPMVRGAELTPCVIYFRVSNSVAMETLHDRTSQHVRVKRTVHQNVSLFRTKIPAKLQKVTHRSYVKIPMYPCGVRGIYINVNFLRERE